MLPSPDRLPRDSTFYFPNIDFVDINYDLVQSEAEVNKTRVTFGGSLMERIVEDMGRYRLQASSPESESIDALDLEALRKNGVYTNKSLDIPTGKSPRFNFIRKMALFLDAACELDALVGQKPLDRPLLIRVINGKSEFSRASIMTSDDPLLNNTIWVNSDANSLWREEFHAPAYQVHHPETWSELVARGYVIPRLAPLGQLAHRAYDTLAKNSQNPSVQSPDAALSDEDKISMAKDSAFVRLVLAGAKLGVFQLRPESTNNSLIPPSV